MTDGPPRSAGVLLHITSLPGPFGIGDFGSTAYRFIDWLSQAGATIWQTLPLSPTAADGSPYGSWSCLALNELLISPRTLVADGWLDNDDLPDDALPQGRIDFAQVRALKQPLIRKACQRVVAQVPREQLEQQCLDGAIQHAEFAALRGRFEEPWWQWERGQTPQDASELVRSDPELRTMFEQRLAAQWLAFGQWRRLRKYANERGVRLFGDVPIYVGHDSVDVWAAPEMFELDHKRQPVEVAGVPPDAFSDTGQRWGNPLYRWSAHDASGYAWWIRRLAREFELCDIVRIDHFRGLQAFWSIPADDPDATGGRWRPGPSIALFSAVRETLGDVDVVAEDLGLIDAPVRQLLKGAGLPGMSVLQFAFGDPHSRYLPHAQVAGSVCYTGTHDNDTTLGWWRSANEHVRDHTRRYLAIDGHDISWDMIRACLRTVADRAIVPVQDILSLGTEARMNVPGTEEGNWTWRLGPGALRGEHADRFRRLVHLYGRGGRR